MPIPVRKKSAASGESSALTRSGGVPQSEARVVEEPTRLARKPASDRATTSTSARGVSESKPRDPGLATKVDISDVRRGTHSTIINALPSASYSSANRENPAVSEGAVGAKSVHAQHGTPVGNVSNIIATSRSHGRPMGASTRSKETVETRNMRGASSKPNASAPFHSVSSTIPRASLVRAGKAPVLSTTKPAFSTYQKQFSPRKPATAPFPSDLASDQVAIRAGTTGCVSSPTDIQNLKDELLQLSLVHEKSAATLQSYETSMKLHLTSGYEVVEEQLRLLKSLRRDRQATTNALAMSEWLEKERRAQNAASIGPDTLLLLAHILKELQDVSKEDGPLEDSMQIFEGWWAYTSSRRSTRDADNLVNGDDRQGQGDLLRNSSAVSPQWSALVSSVEDRIRACAASLGDLQRPPEASSIGLLTKMYTILAEQILQEIGVCRDIVGLACSRSCRLGDAELHHSAANAARASARRGIWTAR